MDTVMAVRTHLSDLWVQEARWIEGLSCCALKSIIMSVQRSHVPWAALSQWLSAEKILRQVHS